MIPLPAPWACATCHAGVHDACERLTARCTIDAELVIHRLEQAGATLLALRDRSPYPAPYRCALPDVLQDFWDTYGRHSAAENQNRPSPPPSRAITAMDRTLQWLSLIPQHRYVLRRIVAARLLVDPISGRHMVHWRRLADTLHCDYRPIQRWHAQGIGYIVDSLTRS